MGAAGRPAIGVLVSGGLDSAALVHALLQTGSRVVPCYLHGGLRWETAEMYWLARLLGAMRCARLASLETVRLPLRAFYGGSHWSLTGRGVPGPRSRDAAVYLPGRNLLLVSAAAIRLAPRRVATFALGTLGGNPFRDATPRFFRQLAACLTQALGTPIHIVTPLAGLRKPAVIRSISGLPLALTFSCLRPRGLRHCGRCNKCAERQRAFRRARVADPTGYAR